MLKLHGIELKYADKLNDGSIRFTSQVEKKYSEIVVQNSNIVRASAGMSHTYFRTCDQCPEEAIDYMAECPECLAELLLVLSPNCFSYEFAKDLLVKRAKEMQDKLDKIQEVLSKA